MNNCIECVNHRVINDPDPHDWFCDDDMAVVCSITKNDKRDAKSEYASDKSEFKVIACSVRPYNLTKESKIPEWCPL